MRNISFALTTAQVLAQTKTVTRRLGWYGLQPGTLLQPIAKGQGLKKGEQVEKVGGPIRIVSVRQELLERLTADLEYGCTETAREGLASMRPSEFVAFFCRTHGCTAEKVITRIEFAYVAPSATRTEPGV